MHAARTDSTHKEIVQALRAVGCVVWDASGAGNGAPDLVVLRRVFERAGGGVFFLECKSAKGKLNERQKKWHEEWKGYVFVVHSVEEALKVVGIVV